MVAQVKLVFYVGFVGSFVQNFSRAVFEQKKNSWRAQPARMNPFLADGEVERLENVANNRQHLIAKDVQNSEVAHKTDVKLTARTGDHHNM